VPTEPIATLRPTSYFLQTWDDRKLKPGTTYYYQVFAEDWAGNRQRRSPVGSAKTPGH
jgi:phosphodiesterase/alkaline phosphatase D-like protein